MQLRIERTKVRATECPHLGLADDPLRHEARVSDEHRCYAGLGRERVDLGHQRRFCLAARHARCPFLIVSQPEPGVFERIGTWSRTVSPADLARMAAQLGVMAELGVATARPHVERFIRLAMRSARALGGLCLQAWSHARPHVTSRGGLATFGRQAPAASAMVEEPAAIAMVDEPVLIAMVDEPTMAQAIVEETPVVVADPAPVVVLPVDDVDLVTQGIAAIEAQAEAEAYALFKRATERNPRDAKTWFWRAKTAETLDEVILCLRHAFELEPHNALIAANLDHAVQRREAARARPARPRVETPRRQSTTIRDGAGLIVDALRTVAALAALAIGGIVFLSAIPPQLRVQNVPTLDVSPLTNLVHVPLGGGYDAGSALPYTLGLMALFAGIRLLNGGRPSGDPTNVSRGQRHSWRT